MLKRIKRNWYVPKGQEPTDFDKRILSYQNRGELVPTRKLIKTPEQIEGIKRSCEVNTGVLIFFGKMLFHHTGMTEGIEGVAAWSNLVGLALLPTVVSTATLALATRNIGATKASVLGVFEPITAILVGTIVFGEALTANIVVGILISVVAITFMISATKR